MIGCLRFTSSAWVDNGKVRLNRTDRDPRERLLKVLLPHIATGKELAREHHDGEEHHNKLEDSQAADCALNGRIRLFRSNFLSTSEFKLSLCLVFQPLFMQLFALFTILCVAAKIYDVRI